MVSGLRYNIFTLAWRWSRAASLTFVSASCHGGKLSHPISRLASWPNAGGVYEKVSSRDDGHAQIARVARGWAAGVPRAQLESQRGQDRGTRSRI